jgi:dolichol-phosphate mannosyltransferase
MTESTLVVVPTFNEAESISQLLLAVRGVLPGAHLLVVDDGSPDGTASIVRGLADADAHIHVLERPCKLGLGSAYVAGFSWGLQRGYRRFFEMDADFSHDPKELPAFVAALDAGADVVVGSRGVPGGGVRGWGPLRYALSKGGSLYSRLVLGVELRDLTTGFKAYSRRALELIDVATLRSNGYAFQIETSYRALRQQLRVLEIPIVFVDRRVGKSKMTSREVWDAVVGVWLMRVRGKRSTP